MLPTPWNPDQINPALMTSQEYHQFCNENDKWHPDSAYDFNIEKLHRAGGSPSKNQFTKIKTFTIKGISFDLMYRSEKLTYSQRNPDAGSNDDPWMRLDGKVINYTDEEIKRLSYQPYGFHFAIYVGDVLVAIAQDEWNCLLIAVAEEYRGFGLGTIIGKIARTYEPGKSSGGFTPMGSRNLVRIHREFVRDALKSGLYSSLVRAGKLTMERVKEIVKSAKVQMRPSKDNVDLSSNSPDDWLLYADQYGSFILYDRKLAHLIDNNKYEHFTEAMMKGYVYAMPDESAGITRIKQFGADTKGLKAFMLALAYTNATRDKLPLCVEEEEYDLPGFEYGPEDKVAGYTSKEIISGKIINYAAMVKAEYHFRRGFDIHDEFKHRLEEMAISKFRIQDKDNRHPNAIRRYG